MSLRLLMYGPVNELPRVQRKNQIKINQYTENSTLIRKKQVPGLVEWPLSKKCIIKRVAMKVKGP